MNLHKTAQDIGLEWGEFLEIMELFLETALSDLSSLQKALDRGEAEEAARSSHSIKGACLNLCFNELSALAASLETKARSNTLEEYQETMARLREGLLKIEDTLRQHSATRP